MGVDTCNNLSFLFQLEDHTLIAPYKWLIWHGHHLLPNDSTYYVICEVNFTVIEIVTFLRFVPSYSDQTADQTSLTCKKNKKC